MLENATKLSIQLKEKQDLIEQRFEYENKLSRVLVQISVAIEDYPNINSNRNITQILKAFNETDKEISTLRRVYNVRALKFNKSIQAKPIRVVAELLSYKKQSYYRSMPICKEFIRRFMLGTEAYMYLQESILKLIKGQG